MTQSLSTTLTTSPQVPISSSNQCERGQSANDPSDNCSGMGFLVRRQARNRGAIRREADAREDGLAGIFAVLEKHILEEDVYLHLPHTK